MKKRNFENNIYMKLFNWAYIFLVLSILLTITNFPLVLSMLALKLNFASLPIFILSLIFLLPALTAELMSLQKLMQERTIAPVKTYFISLKAVFKESFVISLITLSVFGILTVDLKFLLIHREVGRVLMPLFIILMILVWSLAISTCYFLSIHPQTSLREHFRFALVHLVKKWYIAILNVVIVFLMVALMLLKPQFGLVVTPSLLILLLNQNYVMSVNAILNQN